ncbi:MAG: hypothetical protein J6A68_03220 [Oscillospiraceae bacterium]|nr:hypothetical protein [Oscillospiraceae bacterium]
MKPIRLLACLFSFLLLISLVCACTVTPDEESSLESSSETSSFHQVENEEIASQFQDLPNTPYSFTNMTYTNTGKCGDNDGPAYMVYSTIGFTKASFDLKLSEVKINNLRKSDGLRLNAYLFLNADVHDENGDWVNCFDAGFCYSSQRRGWHLCYNLYTTITGVYPWYESRVTIDPTHDYRLILDVSEKENQATLTAYDLTENKVADSVTFEAAYTKPDGSNVSFTQNFALDYPQNVMFTPDGQPSTADWMGIARYNTNEGVYMKDIRVSNSTLYKGEESFLWTEDLTSARSIWPDQLQGLEYPVAAVRIDAYDNSFEIDFNMNHPLEKLPEPLGPYVEEESRS